MVKKPRLFFLSLAISLVGMLSNTALTVSIAAELEEIKSRGKLIVAVKDNLRPLGFYDSIGNLQGLEIDIAKGIAEKILGSSDAVILKPVSNADRLDVLLEGKVDLTVARVTATTSRHRLVEFSTYYYLDGTGLIAKKPSIVSLGNLSSAKIAVLKDSSSIAVVRSNLPNAQLVSVNSYQEALTLLEAGIADAFAGDITVLTGWVQEYPQYRLLPERLSGEALCVIMPKGLQYVDLRTKVNSAIAEWKKSGWLRRRATYWGLP